LKGISKAAAALEGPTPLGTMSHRLGWIEGIGSGGRGTDGLGQGYDHGKWNWVNVRLAGEKPYQSQWVHFLCTLTEGIAPSFLSDYKNIFLYISGGDKVNFRYFK